MIQKGKKMGNGMVYFETLPTLVDGNVTAMIFMEKVRGDFRTETFFNVTILTGSGTITNEYDRYDDAKKFVNRTMKEIIEM